MLKWFIYNIKEKIGHDLKSTKKTKQKVYIHLERRKKNEK